MPRGGGGEREEGAGCQEHRAKGWMDYGTSVAVGMDGLRDISGRRS